jgi:serine/threonine protein kinase
MRGADRAGLEARAIRPEAEVGPYRITGILGRGGMGRVFSAVHVETGRSVAIKTIAKLEAITLECFYEEIVALRQLDHPGVVPVYESGSEQGQPWYAMQLLQGPMLRDVLRSHSEIPPLASQQTRPLRKRSGAAEPPARLSVAPPRPVPSQSQLLQLCCGVLDTLNYIHSRGIVHGDLKPENIFAADLAAPVLVDFGIALPFDRLRERLVLSHRGVGSAAYMAPEQVRGELLDARADLYALGCILYECLTGVQPFVRDTVEGTLLAHLRFVPPSVTEISPSVPAAVAGLIDRLLAKSRGARPGYAHDVLDALLRHGAVDWQRQRSSPPGYLYRPVLVGRELERQQLLDVLEDAFSGRGSRVILTGPPGIGKTRLLADFVDLAEAAGVATFKAEALGPEAQGSARPLASIVPLLSAFAAVSSSSAQGDAELLSTALALANGQAAAAIPDEELAAVLTRALVRFCSSGPLLLAADDPDACDRSTRAFLARAAELNFEQLPLLLAFCAPNAEGRSLSFEELPLSPLTEAEVRAVIESTLSVEMAPRQLVESGYHASAGNPLVLCQYLRTLIEGQVLRRMSRQGWYVDWQRGGELSSLARSPRAQDWFSHRLAQLATPERGLVETAAVLGESFEIGALQEIA